MTASSEVLSKARQIREELYRAAKDETLTATQLSEAVRFVYDDGDNYNASVGADWIWNNPELVSKLLPDTEAFFREHLEILATTSIGRRELFMLVPPDRRVQYLKDALAARTPMSCSWVAIALACDVPRQEIAEQLKAQMERRPEYHCRVFVEYGAGELPPTWQEQKLPQETPWAMFDDEELKEVLRFCMKHAPAELIVHRVKIVFRLGMKAAHQLCAEAVVYLDRVVDLDFIMQLPLETRLDLAKRLSTESFRRTDENARFITSLTIELVKAGEAAESSMISNLLAKITWAPTLYAAVHSLDMEAPACLERVLQDRLTQEGFIIGTLQRAYFTPKGESSPMLQLQLQHGNRIYVQDRRQHEFRPKEGDRVIVQPQHARHLTVRDGVQVLAAQFIPTKLGRR